jgi:hypothetical protein
MRSDGPAPAHSIAIGVPSADATVEIDVCASAAEATIPTHNAKNAILRISDSLFGRQAAGSITPHRGRYVLPKAAHESFLWQAKICVAPIRSAEFVISRVAEKRLSRRTLTFRLAGCEPCRAVNAAPV